MSTKIITEIVESLKDNFDENALQIIESVNVNEKVSQALMNI